MAVAVNTAIARPMRTRLSAPSLGGVMGEQTRGEHPGVPTLAIDFTANKSLPSGITFSRADATTADATYFDSIGVLRNAAKNLLLQSETFNTTWVPINLLAFGSGSVADAILSPINTLTADLIVESTATGQHQLNQSFTFASSTQYTFSCYVKAGPGARNFGLIPAIGSNFASVIFNPTTGAIVSTSNGGADPFTGVSAAVEALPGGWYRVKITTTSPVTAGAGTLALRLLSGTISSYAGDGTSGLYLWGAQLEFGGAVTPYIPTTTVSLGAPRFDHDPVTGESLGLRIEESRTNSVRNNTMVGAVAGTPGTLPTNWGITGSGLGTLVQQVVGSGVQNGISYVDVRFSGTTSTTSFNLDFETTTGIVAANGETWTSSFWAAIVGGSVANITGLNVNIAERTAAGGFVTNNNIPLTQTATLTRNTLTRTLAGGGTVARVVPGVAIVFSSGVAIDITLRIGMPQMELGAFVTSVIPTSGSTVTRAADVASMTGTNFSSWFNATEGTFVAAWRSGNTLAANFPRPFEVSDGTGNEIIRITRNNSTAQGRPSILDGGVAQFAADIGASTVSAAFKNRTAIAYKANDFAASQNGGTVVTDSSGTLPAVDRLVFGDSATPASANNLGGTIASLTYYTKRLSDSLLRALSA